MITGIDRGDESHLVDGIHLSGGNAIAQRIDLSTDRLGEQGGMICGKRFMSEEFIDFGDGAVEIHGVSFL